MTNNNMKKTPLILAFASLVPVAASAGPVPAQPITDCKAPVECHPCLSYDFIDLDYGQADFSNAFLNDDADRLGISFSKSLGDTFFLTGSYTNTDADYFLNGVSNGLEEHSYRLGLGARYSLAKCIDLTFEGGFDHRDITANGNGIQSFDSWGYYVGPGIRARAGRLEGFAKAFYFGREGVPAGLNINDEGWVFNPGVLFHLTDHLALKFAADLGEDYSAVTVGARIHF